MKVPKIQPSAGAEALLWEVRVSDDLENGHDLTTTFQHYLRVKIFTDRGREAFATVDIPYSSGMVVKDVAARTIRPDGSIIELKDSDIYRRTILKANDLKISAVSFAVPAIEPGAIVEYRWREVFRDSLAANLRLRFSREIPVHAVRYYIRPLAIPGFSMVAWPFNGEIQPPRKQENGFHMLALDNVPGDAEETYGPPAYEQRPWVFIGYELRGRSKSPDYYEQFGKELHEEYSKRSKPNDEIRAVAASAIAGATTDGARVAALTQTAREKIRRVDIDTADPADLRNARDAKNAADALRRGIGTGDDVVLLFLAMASASGLEARVAATPSRGDLFVRSIKPHPYFMRGRVVAVRSTTGWLFADPTNEYSERGRLRWDYEDQRVLIADAREPVFAQTPPSLPAETAKKRTGTFRLLEDGTLEGEARIEYTGHWADTFREQEDHDTPAQRERDLRDSVAKRLTGAEISDIRIEHVTDLRGPYTNVYSIRVPGYAQRTGSRLFLQPAVFQKGIEAIFQAAERKADVYFPFAWSEDDAVTIELPAGFTVEQPQALPRMDIGAASYESSVVTEARRLSFRRKVAIGENGIFFAVAHYRPLRAFFDALHRADATTVVLRRSDGSQ